MSMHYSAQDNYVVKLSLDLKSHIKMHNSNHTEAEVNWYKKRKFYLLHIDMDPQVLNV